MRQFIDKYAELRWHVDSARKMTERTDLSPALRRTAELELRRAQTELEEYRAATTAAITKELTNGRKR